MTNFEKYKTEILAIVNQNKPFGVCNGKIKECLPTTCPKCNFYDTDCPLNKIKWLYEEAASASAPTLTKEERAFCKVMGEGYITRNKSGNIFVHEIKPQREAGYWGNPGYMIFMEEEYFPFITEDDEKPWSIEDLLMLEVEE